jgi:lysophospholipase L1-like esterase
MRKNFRRTISAGGLIAAIITAAFLTASIAKADTATTEWLGTAPLNLQKQASLSTLPPTLGGNVDCFQEDAATCVANTAYGTFNTSTGAVKLKNTSTYRTVISYVDGRARSIPIPNSNTIINFTTEPVYGIYLYFTNNFTGSITSSTVYGSDIPQYQINRMYDAKLADKAGHRLPADSESISFSQNGKWMVVSEPNIAILRVNLETFEVTPFAPGFNYTIGLGPSPQTAISNDGRYAVVASKAFSRFELYDINTCGVVPDTISGPLSCQSRDLQNFMGQQVAGYTTTNIVRFISDDTLSLYSSSTLDSVRTTAKYILANSSGTIHQQDYLALGDSYISGEGAYNYQPGTDTADNHCHVSLVSYPLLTGHDLNYNSYHSVACSGAVTNDITNTSDGYISQAGPKKRKQDRTSQIPQILTSFSPGYINQLDFVSQYQPKVITVSIGGNDIGFSSILRKCVLSIGSCYSTYEDRVELLNEVDSKFPAFADTYTKIKNAASPDSKIYVIGYPQLAKPGGDCAVNVRLDAQEIDFSRMLIDYLDGVIKTAADKAGVKYVDVQDALNGYRLCEAGPGSVAMNGLTNGTDFPNLKIISGLFGNESYHPNALGHQLLENKLLSATHNLTDAMPAANQTAILPSKNNLEILQVPHSGRSINNTYLDDGMTDDVVTKNSTLNLSINGSDYSLKPGTNYRIEIHSDSVVLGSYATDSGSNLSRQIQLPVSIPAGVHTIHVYGTNFAGDSIDIYKTIYVAASDNDFDGDGIPNNAEKCVVVEPSLQDYDQDGIDDACDGTIAEAPVISPPPASTNTNSSKTISQKTDSLNDSLQLALAIPTNQPSQSTNSTANDFTVDVPLQSGQNLNDNRQVLSATTEKITPSVKKSNHSNQLFKWIVIGSASILIIFVLVWLPI